MAVQPGRCVRDGAAAAQMLGDGLQQTCRLRRRHSGAVETTQHIGGKIRAEVPGPPHQHIQPAVLQQPR
ncbi:hypothetical protein [Streptomyces atratus]|uniref:hypothetical protein n=1 Tax=Streptomyces atratus TaxID=1893 RepID=UPI001E283D7A|nr:hypothetical protein [Streptomyces atratus]